MAFTLSSPVFTHMGEIPNKYTCVAEDISPPLQWHDIPENTVSFALIVDDPDAPDPAAPKTTWVHWVLYNLPANIRSLSEAIDSASLPEGALQGINDWSRAGYGGPCPPVGRHRYFFKLFALDIRISNNHKMTKAELESVMEGHIIKKTELIGTFQK